MNTSGRTIRIEELRSILRTLADKAADITKKPNREQLEALISAYREGNLVLVLGAGVSIEAGLLDWATLLQKLLIATIVRTTQENTARSDILARLFNKVFDPNPLIAARHLQIFYRQEYGHDPLAFNNAVRDALYAGLNADARTPAIKEICQLCIAPGKSPNLRAIISYNYDDVLERALANAGVDVPVKSIFAPGMHPSQDELAIYHVHGFLPRGSTLTKENQIILSEDFYHQQYADVYGWSNLVQINNFKDSTCLFLGTSLTDPNQRRLLEIAKTLRGDDKIHHYVIRKTYEADAIEHSLKRVLEDHPDLLDQKQRVELPFDTTVKELIEVMENFMVQDAHSFGIGTIWIDDHAKLAGILQQIRKMQNRKSGDAGNRGT